MKLETYSTPEDRQRGVISNPQEFWSMARHINVTDDYNCDSYQAKGTSIIPVVVCDNVALS